LAITEGLHISCTLYQIFTISFSGHACIKPGCGNVRYYYAIKITASQFLAKPCDTSARVAWSCNCEFAVSIALYLRNGASYRHSYYIMCEYEVVTLSDHTTNPCFKVMEPFKGEYLKNGAF